MRDFDLTLDDLVSVMRQRAQLHPDRVAIDFLGDGDKVTGSLTYAELDQRARALAATLQSSAAPGDRALLLLPSGPDYVVAFFACLYAGVIAVPVYPPEANQLQALKRLLSIAHDADAAFVLTDAPGELALAAQPLSRPGMHVLVTSSSTAQAEDWQPHAAAPHDIAFLQYTSGSTANPKGVMVSHANLVANKQALSHALQEGPGDCFVSWLPLFHDMGLILGLLQPMFYGLRLVLMSPKHFLERPRRWLEAISRHRGTVSFGPDFAYRLCADRLRPATLQSLDLSCWRVAGSGAEPIRHATMLAFAERFASLRFDAGSFNPCYGLAEATLFATGHPQGGLIGTCFDVAALAKGQARPGNECVTLVACGTPHASTELLIADPQTGSAMPEGRVGEIWFRGPTVAGGYWRHDAATEATFAARDAQGRGPYLRTGDLGFVHEGQLYVSSRLKDLIILRGRNFYPQDIELEVETLVVGVRPSRVAAFAVEHDGAEAIGIVAEAARLRPGEGTADDVVQRIRDVVAQAFHEPVAAVALIEPGALPKTSSGKLQRSATRQAWLNDSLPIVASYRAGTANTAEQVFQTDTQRRLAPLWQALLDVDTLTPSSHFVALGGQSILVARLVASIRAEFVVAFSIADCFAAQDLADMARRIDSAAPMLPTEESPPVLAAGDTMPLSHAQRRLWFLQSLQPDIAYYYVAIGVRFGGGADACLLHEALDALAARHASLRSVAIDTDSGPVQRLLPPTRAPFEVFQLQDESHFADEARRFVARPFDWERGPLWRAMLVEGAGVAPRLLLAMHHIVVDGASLQVMLNDLAQAYRGEPFTMPAPSYADVALRQDAAIAPELSRLGRIAAEQLHDAPTLSTLPTDHARPATQSHRGAVLRVDLAEGLTARLERWAKQRQATLFMALFAAFAASLAVASGQDDLVVGTDVAHRPQPEGDAVVGFFVNQMPLRWKAEVAASPDIALHAARQALLAAYERQDLPFDTLVERVKPPRLLSQAPVFQTKFVFQEWPERLALSPGLPMDLFDIERETAELDLLFDGVRRGQQVSFRIEYATDLYRRETVQRFADAVLARLTAWVDEGSAPVPPKRTLQRRAARQTTPSDEVQA